MSLYLIFVSICVISSALGQKDLTEKKLGKEISSASQRCLSSFLHYLLEISEPKCCATNPSPLKFKDINSALFNGNTNFKNLSTSVWCSSSDVSGLRCKFDNLCYFPNKREFIFIASPFSVMYGVNSMLQLSSELFSSSLKGHTAFKVNFAVVNLSSIENYKINFVQQRFLLFSRFKPDNLHHIFHDDLLPLYFTVQELSTNNMPRRDVSIIPIVIDEFGPQEYDFLYKFVSKDLYFLTDFPSESWTCFSESHIGLNLMSIFFDYSNGAIDRKYQRYFNRNLLDAFVHSFTDSFNLSSKQTKKMETIKVVIINRKTTRKILNIDEIQKLLYSYINHTKHTEPIVKVMSLEDDGILPIIRELQTTKVLIGMHGAALILSIFMTKSSSLVELWPFGINPSIVPVYRIICEIKGIKYRFWVNEDIHNSQVHPEYPRYYGGIDNWTPKQFLALTEKLKMTILEEVKCCDNPEWLLRIYQDTVVNIYPTITLKSKVLQHSIDDDLNVWSDSIPQNIMFPNLQYLSKVEDAVCNVHHVQSGYTKIILMWNSPWNSNAIGCKEISFEIIIKALDNIVEENYGIYYTKEQTFMKRVAYTVSNFHVWITPLCMGEQGSVTFIHCK